MTLIPVKKVAVSSKDLAAIPLFSDLSTDELNLLSRHFHRKTFACGDPLLLAGHASDVIYVVLSGTVKIFLDDHRNGVTVTICGPGDILGEMSAIDGLGHSASVVATEACQCAYISNIGFCQALETMPALTMNLYRSVASRLRLATTRIHSLASQNVQGRVARQLLVFARKYSGDRANPIEIPLRLTQTEIGALVGATRGSVNKALKYFTTKGYISTNQQYRITVHDQDALQRHCN